MLDVLEQIHKIGYLHRSIKPNHFIISGEEKVILLDYSLAWNFKDSNNSNPGPSPLASLAALQYSSLHQLNHSPSSRRDDLESLGYIILSLLTSNGLWFQS